MREQGPAPGWYNLHGGAVSRHRLDSPNASNNLPKLEWGVRASGNLAKYYPQLLHFFCSSYRNMLTTGGISVHYMSLASVELYKQHRCCLSFKRMVRNSTGGQVCSDSTGV